MRKILIIGILITLTSCNLMGKKNPQPMTKDSLNSQIDKILPTINNSIDSSRADPYDSLAIAYVDTSTLRGKRHWIRNQFLAENRPSPTYDTLFDLTYDGFKDYVIGYYGQSGTGIKNRVRVYIFNPKKHCYILNEQLSGLTNPTFYVRQKMITGFYLGNGGGGGSKFEWINGKWASTKEFNVYNDDDSTKWRITYPLKKKTEVVIRPYEMIPPKDILETDVKW